MTLIWSALIHPVWDGADQITLAKGKPVLNPTSTTSPVGAPSKTVPLLPQIREIYARSFSVVILAIASLLLLSTVPATAHDGLTASAPASEETVPTLPGEIQLTFSNPPSGIGATVIVSDDDGTDWAEGPVSVTNAVATQLLRPGAPAGTYTVQWRVVSSDSHPIEGTYSFTAVEGAPAGETGQTTESGAPSGEPQESGSTDTEATANTDSTISGMGGVILVMVLAGLAVIGGLIFFTRRSLRAVGKK